jgi:hypothetical protein
VIHERTRQVVERAAERIRNGWCQFAFKRDELVCLGQALEFDRRAMHVVARQIDEQYPHLGLDGLLFAREKIIGFNDHPGTTKAKVLAILEKAAAS